MKLIILAAAFLSLAGVALAQGAGEFEGMLRADANSDGAISRAEARAGREAMFDRLDANASGFVEASEMGERGRMLGRADGNGDGKISRTEFMDRPMRGFDRFDANNNDMLDAAEIAQMREAAARFQR
jgi:hypothetical protein